MNIFESVRIAWTALVSNKLRSFLTMLGMIIGVGSVIGMLALGNGMQAFFSQAFAGLGIGTFYVAPFINSNRVDAQQSARLSYNDMMSLLQDDSVTAVKALSIEYTMPVNVYALNQRHEYSLRALTPSAFSIASHTLSAGRFYTELEEQNRSRVALLGIDAAEEIFGTSAAAIGQRIQVNNVNFEVVGVINTNASPGIEPDPKTSVFMPYQSGRSWIFRNNVNSRVDISYASIQAISDDDVQLAIEQVTNALRARHRLTYQDNDFSVVDVGQIANTFDRIIGGLNAFLSVVAGISLLVGGIGIMNIMLVSVSERTREIGLRKAVGARRRDILIQFLVEAVVLCLIGGAIGVLIGFILSLGGTFVLVNLAQAEGAEAQVTFGAIALATAISSFIGITFGFWPAYQASQLSPMEALRYE
jgi:putative ABC transport system permease protein